MTNPLDDPKLPKVALALVVRDEERFLEQNLAFHAAVGVGKFYVYLDRCTDRSAQIARACPAAEVIERDRRPDQAFMSSYQTECLGNALTRARRDGVDWLLHVDADEFAWGENRREPHGSLPRMIRRAATRLRGLGRRVDQIILRTVECVPTPLNEDENFTHLNWFQDGGALPREILDPTDGVVKRLDDWLGGRRGKSLVRVAADAVPDSAHAWKRRGGGGLTTVGAGLHYHYVVTDWRHWREKYRKFAEYPSHWEKGKPVRFPKQAWKYASLNMSEAEVRAYFDRWVVADPAELRRAADKNGRSCLRCDETIRRVLSVATTG